MRASKRARAVFLARNPGRLVGYSGLDAPVIINRDAIAELIEPLVINVTHVTLPLCQRLKGLNRFPLSPLAQTCSTIRELRGSFFRPRNHSAGSPTSVSAATHDPLILRGGYPMERKR